MPTDSFKVLIVEKNGIELENQEEFNIDATVIPFSSPDFTADNVKDALEEAGSADFCASQYIINNSEILLIKAGRQMRTFGQQIIEGVLIIDGWLIVD